MKRIITLTAIVALLLVGAVAPTLAAPTEAPGGTVDECMNADEGPSGEDGPPSFVGGLVPDFLGDLFSDLPVPGFFKAWTGAASC